MRVNDMAVLPSAVGSWWSSWSLVSEQVELGVVVPQLVVADAGAIVELRMPWSGSSAGAGILWCPF